MSLVAKQRPRSPGGEERLLDSILGVSAISHDCHGQPEQPLRFRRNRSLKTQGCAFVQAGSCLEAISVNHVRGAIVRYECAGAGISYTRFVFQRRVPFPAGYTIPVARSFNAPTTGSFCSFASPSQRSEFHDD